tara:strand:- start:10 stop:3795 length:3786 start_codon:yes stop_codon:yes gene_type:complete
MPFLEPHLAYASVMAHESLWVDSALIPPAAVGALAPVLGQDGSVDVQGDLRLYSRDGAVVAHKTRGGARVSSVQKRVRVRLSRGAYSEYYSQQVDVRRVIPANFSGSSGGLYRVVLEYEQGGEFHVLGEHLWDVQYMSGVVVPRGEGLQFAELFLTGYFYCGRVGIPPAMADPSSDDIREGAVNKYFSRELMHAYLGEYAVDNEVRLNISVSSSDDVPEGVVNQFFTSERFDSAFSSKTLDDLAPTSRNRAVSHDTMSQLNLSLGAVAEVKFTPRSAAPADKNANLYVEQILGENVLFFDGHRVDGGGGGGGGGGETGRAGSVVDVVGEHMGEFAGRFAGQTIGVHTGDVVGNVQGFVSDLGNHPIIEAKLVGTGEGHWVGTVNGDVVGKFEGYAKITTGSLDNADHVAIGTYDTGSSLHVKAGERHVQLSHTNGQSVLLECSAEGDLQLSSPVRAGDVGCEGLRCAGDLDAGRIHVGTLNSTGIDNNFSGIFDAGRVEGVSELVADGASLGRLSCGALAVGQGGLSCSGAFAGSLLADHAAAARMDVSLASCGRLECGALSVSALHVQDLAFDASIFSDLPVVAFDLVSASSGIVGDLSVHRVHASNLLLEGGSLLRDVSADSVHSGRVVAATLSVSELALGSALEVDRLSASHLHTGLLGADAALLGSVRCGACSSLSASSAFLFAQTLESDAVATTRISAHEAAASTLQADSLHASGGSVHALSVHRCFAALQHSLDLSVQDATLQVASVGALATGGAAAQTLSAGALHAEGGSVAQLQAGALVADAASVHALVAGGMSTGSLEVGHAEVASLRGGVLEAGVLSAAVVQGAEVRADAVHAQHSSAARSAVASLSVSHCASDTLKVGAALSCSGALHARRAFLSVAEVQALGALEHLASRISVHALRAVSAETELLSVSNLRARNGAFPELSCSALRCDDVAAPRGQFELLSVHSIVGLSLGSLQPPGGVPDGLFLSVNLMIEEALLSLGDGLATLDSLEELQSLSCAAGTIDELRSESIRAGAVDVDRLSASTLNVSSLSVATLHGLVLTEELSVTGYISHVSTSYVTSGEISCHSLYVDRLFRTIPHVSDDADPAVLTSGTFADFGLFDGEATRQLGDMIVEGSLYVTDTVFVGSAPTLVIDNVDRMVASRISVGELTVGLLTGLDGGDSLIGSVLDLAEDDTVHRGNMHVDGNLIVSGVILTGAHNKLILNHGSFEMHGLLSVSGDVIGGGGVNLTRAVSELTERIASLEAAVAGG